MNKCKSLLILISHKQKHIYSCAHKFTCSLQNMQNVNNFDKIRGIMKIASYCLFNTVLNKLFHITDVYIFSTRQNNNWIYKNDPVQKFTYPWILILCVVSWMFCDSCSWVLCWSWAVRQPAVLQKNPPAPAHSLVFQHFLHIWTLSNSDCMILRSIVSHGGTHT